MKKPILKILALTAMVGVASFVLFLLFKLMMLALIVGGMALLAKRLFTKRHTASMEHGTAMMQLGGYNYNPGQNWGRQYSRPSSGASIVPIY